MVIKPFRPPLLIRKPAEDSNERRQSTADSGPPTKKRRISEDAQQNTKPAQPDPYRLSQPRIPLLTVKNPSAPRSERGVSEGAVEAYYTVLRKFTAKKHKTWDGDGVLCVRDGHAQLRDVSGREMGKAAVTSTLSPGVSLSVGGKDVEIDSAISREDVLAMRPSVDGVRKTATDDVGAVARTKVPTKLTSSPRVDHQERKKPFKEKEPRIEAPKSKAAMAQFRTPLLTTDVRPRTSSDVPQPRHDPNQPGALVMRRPASVPRGKKIVDVVVDPILCRHLREHQREGVEFMYECVMGLRSAEGEGAILADDMGLGKTLQTIALLWTLLKQNPVWGDPPVAKKVLVVCPVTLIGNWRREFRKWLGLERIGVFVADNKSRFTDFTGGEGYNVMIIGYERIRIDHGEIKKGAGIDIIVADEGHRLKTAKNKSALAIKSFNTERRVVLTGTPIQNDLSEFYTMVDFVNPGFLKKYSKFKRDFEDPILRGRQPEATAKEIEKGEGRVHELAAITDQFVLRRTAEILADFLPPKTEHVIFCRPTPAQASVYRTVLASPRFSAALNSSEASLQLINVLKKVCNSPVLLKAKSAEEKRTETVAALLAEVRPSLLNSPGASTKLRVLDSLLHQIRVSGDEKVVLVSNYTATLDILGNLLSSLSYSFVRLDGSTPSSKRQGIVDRFNNATAADCFVFLLSAKSGGVGLNLIGGSRLVLFDADWNPATDAQAMARIHRDGQKRPCWIYRLLVQGALDEKIFQRQVTKNGLAEEIVDGRANASGFTKDELRDLFTFDGEDRCQTHELLGCPCGGRGVMVSAPVAEKLLPEGPSGDEDLPEIGELVSASQVDMEAQESQIKERAQRSRGNGKPKIQALMQYRHLHVPQIVAEEGQDSLEMAMDDEILLEVLKEKENRVGFVMTKSSM